MIFHIYNSIQILKIFDKVPLYAAFNYFCFLILNHDPRSICHHIHFVIAFHCANAKADKFHGDIIFGFVCFFSHFSLLSSLFWQGIMMIMMMNAWLSDLVGRLLPIAVGSLVGWRESRIVNMTATSTLANLKKCGNSEEFPFLPARQLSVSVSVDVSVCLPC